MIFIVAWRNIWRNRTRSWVVIAAISVGIWAAVFLTGLATGMMKAYVSTGIDTFISHLQIHNKDFLADREIEFRLQDFDRKREALSSIPHIKAYSFRTVTDGAIATPTGMRGTRIIGVDPDTESAVSTINEKIIEGTYFEEKMRNPLLISGRLAEKMKIKMKSKLVLTFQDLTGEITAASFRVAGIFDTGSNPFDEGHVFIRRIDMNKSLLINLESSVDSTVQPLTPNEVGHEVAIILDDVANIDTVFSSLKNAVPFDTVRTYRQISPDLELYESQIKNTSLIYMVIIMLALVFGIINTMLMTVLERYQELGMLMAIGMNKTRVFFMIVFETIMLCMVAVPIGLMIGFLTTEILGETGVNLTAFSKGLRQFGMASYLYPEVTIEVYIQLAIGVAVTALLASLYPAWKAIRLRPVEAIRKF